MAGLARDTDRIGLGVLVSPVTFRHPGSFAKVVTTVDEMSGGRIEVGVGAGWNELEHRQLGLPFPPIGERADLMEDQLAILHGLWGEPDGWSYEGHQVSIAGRRFPPEAGRCPGPAADADRWRPAAAARRRLGLAALVSARGALRGRVQPELVGAGRRPARRSPRSTRRASRSGATRRRSTRSTMAGVLIGRDEGEMADRLVAAVVRRSVPAATSAWLDERLERWITGHAGRGARDGPPLRGGRCRADHAPGLPAVGPRHDRRHGRGPGRAGLTVLARSLVVGIARSARRRPTRRGRSGRRGG